MLTTHYMDEAERLCDRVAIVDHGKVIALETPARLDRAARRRAHYRFQSDRELRAAHRCRCWSSCRQCEPCVIAPEQLASPSISHISRCRRSSHCSNRAKGQPGELDDAACDARRRVRRPHRTAFGGGRQWSVLKTRTVESHRVGRFTALGQLILTRIRLFLREPAAIFWVYGFPILMLVALGIAFRENPRESDR